MFATVSVLLKKDNKNIQFDLFGYINLNFISSSRLSNNSKKTKTRAAALGITKKLL